MCFIILELCYHLTRKLSIFFELVWFDRQTSILSCSKVYSSVWWKNVVSKGKKQTDWSLLFFFFQVFHLRVWEIDAEIALSPAGNCWIRMTVGMWTDSVSVQMTSKVWWEGFCHSSQPDSVRSVVAVHVLHHEGTEQWFGLSYLLAICGEVQSAEFWQSLLSSCGIQFFFSPKQVLWRARFE